MIFDTFIALVAFLALAYAAVSRYIQNRLVDKREMEAIQAESRALSDEMKKAQERKDEARVQELMKEQMEFLPKMNKVMFAQFKPMIFILGIFFCLTWVIGQADPTIKDDIMLNMSDDGRGCDAAAGDGTYSACHLPGGASTGKWMVTAHSIRNGAEVGTNYSWFAYGADARDGFTEASKGDGIVISTDKTAYSAGETVKLYARPAAKPDSVRATLDNGTSFYVDLPMQIPLLNVQRIQQPYWWFIFISFIASLGITVVLGQLDKRKKESGEAGKRP